MRNHSLTTLLSPRRIAPVRIHGAVLLCFLAAGLLAGCSSRVSSKDIRASIASGNVTGLETELRETHTSYGEMVTALNLARICQLDGRWRLSVKAFEEADALLQEYENRAIVNMRGIGSSVGAAVLSAGAESYFGTGYERSLLHTFNALNYIMLADYPGAAVEMRRMTRRQELWLEESQARIEKNLSNGAKAVSPEDLPVEYSMRDLLRDEAVRGLLNNYQDSFSYALAALVYRLAGDFQAADVSMRRAIALDPNAEKMFKRSWPGKQPRAGSAVKQDTIPPAVPPLPPSPPRGERAVDARPGNAPDTQEVTLVVFTGLAPSLGVENVRIWFPAIGYILIDLPTYTRPVRGSAPDVSAATLAKFVFYPLLRTDLMAYRTLWDEVGTEVALAAGRAAVRAGVSAGAYTAAASNKDTRDFAPLIGSLTTMIMDMIASTMSGSVRNWETLPNTGYLAMETVPRGSIITIGSGSSKRLISLPPEARGSIIMITQLSENTLKVHYATY